VNAYGSTRPPYLSGLPYHLAIPPLSTLSPTQKEALHSYLIYSSRIDLIHDAGALYEALLSATPAVTATAARSRIILLDMRRAMLVAPGMVFSALKYAFVWYIFAVVSRVYPRGRQSRETPC
jgi:hypothetical protein